MFAVPQGRSSCDKSSLVAAAGSWQPVGPGRQANVNQTSSKRQANVNQTSTKRQPNVNRKGHFWPENAVLVDVVLGTRQDVKREPAVVPGGARSSAFGHQVVSDRLSIRLESERALEGAPKKQPSDAFWRSCRRHAQDFQRHGKFAARFVRQVDRQTLGIQRPAHLAIVTEKRKRR